MWPWETSSYRAEVNRREVSIYACDRIPAELWTGRYTYGRGPYVVRPNEIDGTAFMSTIISGRQFDTHGIPVSPLTKPLPDVLARQQRQFDAARERNDAAMRRSDKVFEPSRTGLTAFNSVIAQDRNI